MRRAEASGVTSHESHFDISNYSMFPFSLLDLIMHACDQGTSNANMQKLTTDNYQMFQRSFEFHQNFVCTAGFACNANPIKIVYVLNSIGK